MSAPSWSERWKLPRGREAVLVLLAVGYFYFLLTSYFLMRPLREAMGIERGVEDLAWLWTCTLAAIVLVNPVFSWIVARWPRRRFIPVAYRFFGLNLLAFALLMYRFEGHADARLYLGYVFYVWLSVFNLFVVSVFWGFLADVFRFEDSRRLYGWIAVGGTLGAISGSAVTSWDAALEWLGTPGLIGCALVLLEVATQFMLALARRAPVANTVEPSRPELAPDGEAVIGGSALAGITRSFRTPFLRSLGAYVLLYAVFGTALYYVQGGLVSDAFATRDERTAFFARVNLVDNVLTLALQVFVTREVLQRFRAGTVLLLHPLLVVVGFAVLGFHPVVLVTAAIQVVFRSVGHGFTRPARETLFTLVDREARYKAKSFLDTFGVRLGDAVTVWSCRGLLGAGVTPTVLAWIVAPVGLAWAAVAWNLRQRAGSTPIQRSAIRARPS